MYAWVFINVSMQVLFDPVMQALFHHEAFDVLS